MAKVSTKKLAKSKAPYMKTEKKVTRYKYDEIKEPRTPETGHTALLPTEEQVVTVPMDNGWSKAIEVGKLPEGDDRPVVVDMDPAVDPVLFWAGKRNMREVPVLPLQRNEIVSESRIAQIIERARKTAEEKDPKSRQGHLFSDLEKTLRETDRRKRIEFYTHEEGWKNKLICGDSLYVMESLMHYEGLHGKVQMIYFDPPYGIKYDSNFQQRVNSTKNDNKDQADDVLTIKAFRDTWALGIHSYLSYLQERLYLCRELMSEAGSIFVQISDENVHVVRNLVEEVFGSNNFIAQITFVKASGFAGRFLPRPYDFLLWYGKDKAQTKYRALYETKSREAGTADYYSWVELPSGERRGLTRTERDDLSLIPSGARLYKADNITSQGNPVFPFEYQGKVYEQAWKTTREGLTGLARKNRLHVAANSLQYVRYIDDFPCVPVTQLWTDTGTGSFLEDKLYAVQTAAGLTTRS